MNMRRLWVFGALGLILALTAGAAMAASESELDELNRKIASLSEQILGLIALEIALTLADTSRPPE